MESEYDNGFDFGGFEKFLDNAVLGSKMAEVFKGVYAGEGMGVVEPELCYSPVSQEMFNIQMQNYNFAYACERELMARGELQKEKITSGSVVTEHVPVEHMTSPDLKRVAEMHSGSATSRVWDLVPKKTLGKMPLDLPVKEGQLEGVVSVNGVHVKVEKLPVEKYGRSEHHHGSDPEYHASGIRYGENYMTSVNVNLDMIAFCQYLMRYLTTVEGRWALRDEKMLSPFDYVKYSEYDKALVAKLAEEPATWFSLYMSKYATYLYYSLASKGKEKVFRHRGKYVNYRLQLCGMLSVKHTKEEGRSIEDALKYNLSEYEYELKHVILNSPVDVKRVYERDMCIFDRTFEHSPYNLEVDRVIARYNGYENPVFVPLMGGRVLSNVIVPGVILWDGMRMFVTYRVADAGRWCEYEMVGTTLVCHFRDKKHHHSPTDFLGGDGTFRDVTVALKPIRLGECKACKDLFENDRWVTVADVIDEDELLLLMRSLKSIIHAGYTVDEIATNLAHEECRHCHECFERFYGKAFLAFFEAMMVECFKDVSMRSIKYYADTVLSEIIAARKQAIITRVGVNRVISVAGSSCDYSKPVYSRHYTTQDGTEMRHCGTLFHEGEIHHMQHVSTTARIRLMNSVKTHYTANPEDPYTHVGV